MTFLEYPDREMLMMDLANKIAGELAETLLTHDRATLSVPGGTTPGPIFDALSGADLHWDRISVMLNDERWVPEENPRSNTALIRDRLLTGRAAMATYVPLYAEYDTPEEGLPVLAEGLKAHLPISVLLLGMGTDAHTASLFPGADKLTEALAADAPPLMAMRAPGAPEPRITLTAPVLKAAMSTHILITGAEKRDALEAARHKPVTDAPVQAVLGQATVHWAE